MDINTTSYADLKNRLDGSCHQFIPVYSDGIWNESNDGNILKHALLRLYLQIAVTFILTSVIHLLLRRYGLPRLISEILAGIILGPSVLGHFWPDASEVLFPLQSEKVVSALIYVSYMIFMFLIAVKMDISLIKKCSRREWRLCASLTMNLLVITFISSLLGRTADKHAFTKDWVNFFSGVMVLTSFPVIACLLMHLKMVNSEIGRLALSTALVTDLFSVLIVNFYDFLDITKEASVRAGVKSAVLSFALVAFIMTFLRKLMFWIIRRTTEGKPVKNIYIIIIVFFVMVVAIFGDKVGIQFFYGPFIFGLAVPPGPPLASALVEKLDTIITGLSLPVLASYCGYKANIWELNHMPPASITFTLTWGIAMKLAATFVPAIRLKMCFRDAAILTLILNAKGIVELGTFATNSHKQTIDAGHFTMAVVVILIVAMVVPLAVRKLHDSSKLYPGYQQRNILHTAESEYLGILVCTHTQDDAKAAVRLLEVSNPSKGRGLSIFGLYLESISRESTPIIINHQLGQKASNSSGAHQQPTINIFKFFKAEHSRSVNLQVFSAFSLPSEMHKDICWMAFDKSVSLILLPFHRKWNAKGELIADDQALRNLNSKVLDEPPSSVGILLDRSKMNISSSTFVSQSIYSVVVYYFGSEDDIEAVAYATRMAVCSRVHLTVIHFTLSNNCDHTTKRSPLDDLSMGFEEKDEMLGTNNTIYREQIVTEGDDLARMIREKAEKYDLVLVGRRHNLPITSCLSECCEFPELGSVGDLLASSDFNNSVSVLVIQKQNIQVK
ncbi:cation/H(+) antiporter 4-like [Pistacia vera]|uniref:cation/H(+) antiporter 4-like n=1 Tax=Pistacia vera TaxID=55513 RepID=UPI0012630496|nr:cation/H(+) antiporter 4-like [Pistacia vera]